MTAKKDTENTGDSNAVSVESTALFGVCQTCAEWEPRVNGTSGQPRLGYCPIFDKLTFYYHGDKCTAHSDLHAPNVTSEGPPPSRPESKQDAPGGSLH